MKSATAIASLILAFFSPSAFSSDEPYASVEWWTSISDAVLVADVSGITELTIPSVDWKSQDVALRTTALLKGERVDRLVVRQEYLDIARIFNGDNLCVDHALKAGDKVLVFCARHEPKSETEVIFWVNLTKPDCVRARSHSAYDNNCNWLSDGSAVLAVVKARIEKESRGAPTKRRGVVTDFKHSGYPWSFVRTAEPEFKKVVIEKLHSGVWQDQEWALYNSISYPCKEITDLIAPFLNDPTISELDIPGGRDANGKPAQLKVKAYYWRQFAYAALTLAGESPRKPEGYRVDAIPWQFEAFFENRGKFPYGNWKRLEFPARPPVKLGTIPPESIARVGVADLASAIDRVCLEEKANYQRLLWRVHHLTGNSLLGRPWQEVESMLKRQGATQMRQINDQYGCSYMYLFKKDAYVTPIGLAHDLEMIFDVRVHVLENKPSLACVADASEKLVATVNEPFLEFAQSKPYPARSIVMNTLQAVQDEDAAQMLFPQSELRADGVANEIASCPILSKVEIEYCFRNDRWAELNRHVFDVSIAIVNRIADPSVGNNINTVAFSGLDPPQAWHGKKRLDEFTSRDSLGGLEARLRGKWGSAYGSRYHVLKRVGTHRYSSVHENWSKVYNGADVQALPQSTKCVCIMKSDFGTLAVKALVHLPNLEELRFEDEKTTDEDLAVIAKLSNLKQLDLHSEVITDAGISKLVCLTKLESLTFWGSPLLTDECCRSLGQIKSLRCLHFGSTENFTVKGLKLLEGLKELQECNFGRIGGDEGLALISGFTKLQELNVGGNDAVTTKGIACLTKLVALRSLTIGYVPVNDECLREVGKIKSLERLYLNELAITNDGLRHLSGLSNLKFLEIYNSEKVTDAGLKELQSKLPGQFERK